MARLRVEFGPLRSAVTALLMNIAHLVLTSIVGGMYVLFPQATGIVPISIGMLGAVAFLYSTAILVREASLVARVSLQEIAHCRELLEQRQDIRVTILRHILASRANSAPVW
jgi:hypothetical protein